MNLSKLEAYARQARRDFIAAVTDRASFYGLTAHRIEPIIEQRDVALIGTRAFPASIISPRKRLEQQIQSEGFKQVMEVMAYTWFNRFAAIRYMELHDYLDHGYRVLSHPEDQNQPEILQYAADVNLPSLDPDRIVQLKLDGSKDEELYRLLLKAQCNVLHQAMPFLFERLGDETELLLPASLLHTDSLIRKLVKDIDESDWRQIEIVGWLYQFYMAEKKDQVIGKVVEAVDIPAATQLFTPNWIVKYMVQNSLGAQWLSTYPNSPLKEKMEYYIEPARQTDEVNIQLAAITPQTLDPEKLTLIDPACGSGHILVEAYDLFKAIYLERGYRQRDVAKLILAKNLFGLDIDKRATQLTGFALMMKGRADDRRLFERNVKLNVMSLIDSADLDIKVLTQGVTLSDFGLQPSDLSEIKLLFEQATIFGSLIQIPVGVATWLPALKKLSKVASRDLFVSDGLRNLEALVQQTELLAKQYDAVVANPPYMGSKFHIPVLKKFIKDNYQGYENDIFSAFIDRGLAFTKPCGYLGFMSPFVWMFISSHSHLRRRLIDRETITSLIQLEYSGFAGATVPVCTFTLQQNHIKAHKGCFIRLSDFRGADNQAPRTLEAIRNRDCGWFYEATQDGFRHIPGSPVAYWTNDRFRHIFQEGTVLEDFVDVRAGIATGNTNLFLRRWYEVDHNKGNYACESRLAAVQSGKKWFPYNKGGEFRKWYGNQDYLVNWQDDGKAIRVFGSENGGRIRSRVQNIAYFFLPSVTWTTISSSYFGVRYSDAGFAFENTGSSAFAPQKDLLWIAGFLCSKQVSEFMKVLNPTLHFQVGNVASLPVLQQFVQDRQSDIEDVVSALIGFARTDWNSYERSWNFQTLPILTLPPPHPN